MEQGKDWIKKGAGSAAAAHGASKSPSQVRQLYMGLPRFVPVNTKETTSCFLSFIKCNTEQHSLGLGCRTLITIRRLFCDSYIWNNFIPLVLAAQPKIKHLQGEGISDRHEFWRIWHKISVQQQLHLCTGQLLICFFLLFQSWLGSCPTVLTFPPSLPYSLQVWLMVPHQCQVIHI